MKENHVRMIDKLCVIRENRQLTGDIYLLSIEAPAIAEHALPGHFAMIQLPQNSNLLLRRPMSILGTDRSAGSVSIMYRAVGKGTVLLSSMNAGESLKVLGPLGNTFPLDGSYETAVLVAGGIGIPPLVFAIPLLEKQNKKIVLYYGTRTAAEQDVLKALPVNSVPVYQATDDGSIGYHGFVNGLFRKHLEDGDFGSTDTLRLFSCGPGPMMHNAAVMCGTYNIESFFSVETMMACGIGLCQGCVIPVLDKSGQVKEYRLACKDGPVFPGYIIAQEDYGRSIM